MQELENKYEYEIFEDKLAEKFINKHITDVTLINRINNKYEKLMKDPYGEAEKPFRSMRCPKCKKTRIGDYRIIYFIYESEKKVEIIDIDLRNRIYKKWD